MPTISVRCEVTSGTAQLTDELKQRVEEVVADTAEAIADGAYTRAPKRTGFMADSIGYDRERVWVEADYASYVNYGTRWMHAQPFFSEAVAIDGVITMRLGLTSIFGSPPAIPAPMDESVYLMGPLKGIPETWPHRDLSPAAILRRQRRRAKLGYGDRKYHRI